MKKPKQINNGVILEGGNLNASNLAIGKNAKVIQKGKIKNMANDERNSEEKTFEIAKIEGSQIGAIGNNNKVEGNVFNQQNNNLSENIDFERLKIELQYLRENLISKATDTEHFISIGEIANAEKASLGKDGNNVIKHLKSAGSWALDTAKELGINVVTELIKKQIST